MPEFIAVQCFNCELFQVCQRRKDKKFKCKVCSSNQSIRSVLAQSQSASQIRPVVQKANLARGEAALEFEQLTDNAPFVQFDSASKLASQENTDDVAPKVSRWKRFAQDDFQNDQDKEENRSDEWDIDDQITTMLPDLGAKRRRRNRHTSFKRPTERQDKPCIDPPLPCPSHPDVHMTSSTPLSLGPIAEPEIRVTYDDDNVVAEEFKTNLYEAREGKAGQEGCKQSLDDSWGDDWGGPGENTWG